MPEQEQSRIVGTTETGEPMSEADKPVVVGVDGSLHNASAVEWAAEEADRAHRTLCLVTGTAEFSQPRVGVGTEYVVAYDTDLHFNRMMIDLARRIRTEHPSVLVSPGVRRGEASACLAELSRTASVVVVGKRGLGAVRRAMLGSTSIATVGRTRCPTVVVPDDWRPRAHAGEPLLVGIDLQHDSDPVLDFAFARAQRMGVPLIAMHVWEVHPFAVPPAEELAHLAVDAKHAVEGVLRYWREKYPDVEAIASQAHDHPARGLLDASEHTQLLILGRTSSSARLTGLPFGSVTRAVLHYSDRPVAIVPTF
ncbi:MAG TPA: universal stress protein [Nocardioidaceae bacterium]|nr:universal stress protein [Nocardioidaceae bacterium]